MRLLPILFLVCLCLLPVDAVPLDLLGGTSWTLQTPSPADAEMTSESDASSIRHGLGYRVTIRQALDPYYQIQLSHPITTDLPDGTRIRLRFWGRSTTSNPVHAVVEQSRSPYSRALDQELQLTPQWREYVCTATVPAYGLGGLAARFQIGDKVGAIELAGIILQSSGIDPAIVHAQAAVQPAATQSRIRRYRMADLTVIVRDARGRPVPHAAVSVRQTRHAFLFGCNIFGLDPNDHSPAQSAYQSRFEALFNYATLPFYWGSFESTQNKPDYTRLDGMTHWCISHGVIPKGHPLVWHQVYPTWAPSEPDATIPLLHHRVTDIVAHYRGLIDYWDVVNEANSTDPKTGEGAWIARDGAAKVVGTALAWARTAGQGTSETFLYNDFNTGGSNLALLTQLQRQKQLPDAIGLQSHMHAGTWKLTDVWARCEAFSGFGKPIHFTETTVVSAPAPAVLDYNKHYDDWTTTPAGEAAQADYVTQFYTLLFSHPSLRAITWWDLSDQNAWLGAPAGLLRKDMTPKPAYDRLMTLIHKTWWTNAAGRSDAKGRYSVHAFYGDYRVTVTDSHGHAVTRQVTMPEGSGPYTLVLTLP